jgi:hypothetical protein
MRHPHSIFPLVLLFLVPANFLKAGVSLIVESGFETGYSVKDTVDNPPRKAILVPGTSIGQFPDDDTISWINLDIVSSRACYLAARAEWETLLFKHLSLSLSAGLEYEQRDMTLFGEEWLYFRGYNPFYPGSPLQSNGKSNIEFSSRALTPHIMASLKWNVTKQISVGLDAGWGYSFESYDDFDFFIPMHQVMVGIDEIESITSTNSYEKQRWQLGASIGYALSDRWTASVGYQFLFLEDLSLKNTVLSKQGNRYIYSLPMENRLSQRVTFSATCRF